MDDCVTMARLEGYIAVWGFLKKYKKCIWDFHGSPVVKTQHHHCRGRGFSPGQGTEFHMQKVQPKEKEKVEKVSTT